MKPTVSTENTKEVFEELITKNHRENDIYFQVNAHSHTVHLICSLYKLGASEERLRTMYEAVTKCLEPLSKPKHSVDEKNYFQFVGVVPAYRDLLDFFEQQIGEAGFDKVFAKYVPRLLPGIGGEAAHPLIHLGYAVEFHNDLILSEALALCVIGYDRTGELIDQEFSESAYKDPVTIIEEMSRDVRFKDLEKDPYKEEVMIIPYYEYTKEHYKAWDSSIKNKSLDDKVRELSHGIVFLFLGHNHELRLDILLCHALTGLHAGRILLPLLSESDQVRILRLLWWTALTLFASVGRPLPRWDNLTNYPLPEVKNFWEETSAAAIEDGDTFAHAIKCVRTLKELANKYPQDEEMWRHGSWKVLDLIKSPDDWGHRLGLEPRQSN
ncbi:hypothetical protein K7432_015115 [Basidiobolus ranarum]|uniref:Questin oxidase family protein n=1 Tax=Basidiobolus ranarum TaxID=34480 RepID=A0ABR2WGN4_9FUNG